MARPAVLVTHPRHFRIAGGANPHTRESDDSLKTVDRDRARSQWHSYVDALSDGGIDVYVAEPEPELTGMVFTANAGLLVHRLDDRPIAEKTFYPSRFTAEHRRPEADRFESFFQRFGVPTRRLPEGLRFEGEADAFPVGRSEQRRQIFTWGFRSDARVGDWLAETVWEEPPLRLELSNSHFYHGDCLLCDLGGPLLAWPSGLTDAAARRLDDELGDRVIELSDDDAWNFVGNSFYIETRTDRLLYAPTDIADRTVDRIENTGVTVVEVDISEFFGKGGGGPKCMVFNLGTVDREPEDVSEDVRAFRRRRHVRQVRSESAP
ncbi:MAG: dimethylarginine dimethylaminohydrolase family protein [Bradymonadaceae bacterium]